jgi:hypothetical protein
VRYNGFVFESDIMKGLNIYRLADWSIKAKAERLAFLNPQTLILENHFRKQWRWSW